MGQRKFLATLFAWSRPLRRVAMAAATPAYGRALRRAAARARGLDELIDLADTYAWRALNIKPMQVHEEVKALLSTLAALQCRRILEIGTASGGTLFLLCQVAAPDALLVSVDLPAGRFGGGYEAWKAPLFRSFARASQRVRLLRADSHAPATVQSIVRILAGEPLDFLFVDGDHTYEGARTDFETYRSLVRPGGLIAFHDIVDAAAGRVGGVPRLWREVKASYPDHQEIVRSWQQNGFGIGLIRI